MMLTVPLNKESLAFWEALARPIASDTKPATIQLPGDPRRYAVAGATPFWAADPDDARIDVRLVPYAPPEVRR